MVAGRNQRVDRHIKSACPCKIFFKLLSSLLLLKIFSEKEMFGLHRPDYPGKIHRELIFVCHGYIEQRAAS
jgi:hypothetical protein